MLTAPRILGTSTQTTVESAPATGSTSPGTSLRPATLDAPDREQIDQQSQERFQEVEAQQQRGRELNRRDTHDLFQTLADSHRAP
jgi:hypothetical protein